MGVTNLGNWDGGGPTPGGATPVQPGTNPRIVGTQAQPAYQNSFGAYGSGYTLPRFWLDDLGMVHIEGLAIAGGAGAAANTTIFTLPAVYAPTGNLLFANVNQGGSGFASVFSNGQVQTGSAIGANNWVSLAGISFYAGV